MIRFRPFANSFWKNTWRVFMAGLLFGIWGAIGAMAAEPAAAPAADHEDFGQYLAQHQTELNAFIDRNGAEMAKDVTPILFGLLGKMIFISLLLGWVVDVFLSRGFSVLFAPAYSKFVKSLIYASGRLVLSIIFTVLLSLVFVAILHTLGLIVSLLLILFLLVLGLVVQVGWVKYVYRAGLPISFLFYIAILIVHGLVGSLIVGPIVGLQATSVAAKFLDQSVTPRIHASAQETQHQLAGATASRDAIKRQVSDVQGQLTQAQTDLDDLTKQIEQKKNSPEYLFAQIVKVRAKGDLQSAHDQLAAFLTRFPDGASTAAAKGQLDQVNLALVARDQQAKQEKAAQAAAAAQARADLLARAAQGSATLSEVRESLMGKTPAEVNQLFGEPTETASNRWGYGQKMIFNPLTNERHGLTVYFADGVVQSVDYYYGAAR